MGLKHWGGRGRFWVLLAVTGAVIVAALSPAAASAQSWKWTSQISGTTNQLQAVSCPSVSVCEAVGGIGGAFGTTNGGQSWIVQTTGSLQTVTGVSCGSVTDCEITDSGGDVSETTNGGLSWSAWSFLDHQGFHGISCADALDCEAVGEGNGTPYIFGTTDGGQSWTAQFSGGHLILSSVSCATAQACETVGETPNGVGSIYGTTNGGQSWTSQSPPTTNSLFGVSCVNASQCEAVGASGTVIATTNGGQTWTSQNSGTISSLEGVSCVSTSQCEAVGLGGVILGTSNGGQTWTSQTSGTTQDLDGLSCVTANMCEAVGNNGTILGGLGSPLNTAPPTITGTAKDGQALSESHGTWSGSPTSYSYQWEDCDSSGNNCTAITGATGQTHALISGEVGDTLRVEEWATNAAGTGGPATSSQTGVVQAIPPSNTAAPSISGTAKDGQTLSTTNGSWNGTPPLTYTYQWQDCPAGGGPCTSISGATSQSYKLRSSDVGQQLQVVVSADNSSLPGGAKTSATSALYPAGGVVASLPQVGSQRYFNLSSYRLSDRMSLSVNVASGNVMLIEHDLAVTGTGLDLAVGRYYNSEGQPGAVLGSASWTLSVGPDVRLVPESDGSQILYGPSGFEADFSKTGPTSFDQPAGLDATLCAVNGSSCVGDGAWVVHFNRTDEKWAFDSSGRLISDTDKNGNKIAMSYSGGQLQSVTDTQGRVTTFAYDSSGRLTSMTDSAGRTYGYAYDSNGHLTSYTDPAGNKTTFAYDAFGRLTTITDALGNETLIAYDAQNRATSLTRGANASGGGGNTATFAYSAPASPCVSTDVGRTVLTDPDGHQMTYCSDAAGRVTSTTDGLGHTTRTTWDADGNPLVQTNGAGAQTTMTYSNDGRFNPLTTTEATGAQTSAAYVDSAHPYYPSSSTDAQGNTTGYSYGDSFGHPNLTKITEPDGATRTFSYNANGTMASVTDENGHTTSYSYDSKGNLTGVAYPAPQGPTSDVVDGLSRVTSRTDGNAQTTSYTYDALDRVTQETDAGGATIRYVYDADGNLIEQADPSGTTTYTYDAENRLMSQTAPDPRVTSYTYDAADNLTSLTDSGGKTAYAYNQANLLSSLTDPSGAVTSFRYDANDDRTATAYPGGVTLATAYSTDSGGHATSRIARVTATNASGTKLTDFAYSYANSTGGDTALRQSVTDVDGNATKYTYDPMDRLTEAKTTSSSGNTTAVYQYAYDPAGNRTSQTVNGSTTTASYNAANELTQTGSTSYSYDLDGQLTGTSTGSGLTYNSLQQTTSVTPAGGTAVNLAYAGDDQTQRTEEGGTRVAAAGALGLDPVAGGTEFNQNTLGVSDATNSSGSTEYVRDNSGVLTEEQTAGGSTYYYLFDGLGSVVGLADSTGNLAQTYTYDPYGNLSQSTGTVDNPWGFAGQYYDATTGLYQMGARYYNPTLGRWTQQDPQPHPTDPSQADGYTYAGDDPINVTDPTGNDSFGSFLNAVAELLPDRYIGVALSYASPYIGIGVSTYLVVHHYTSSGGYAGARGPVTVLPPYHVPTRGRHPISG